MIIRSTVLDTQKLKKLAQVDFPVWQAVIMLINAAY
ncbi:MAG: hypothetical protein CG441_803 [Methylococcaceae bacterium NSM2-1]|jgi:hypothetical protein|nr:MAG: hypothetical protein CG441_803 [Methylococcaceae bacterium NSM2-1]